MPLTHIKTSEIPWRPPGGEFSGQFSAWTWKNLHEEPEGVSVSMWKLAPGGSDQTHAHDDADEHIYVLGGEFQSNGVTYKAGDYIYRPAGVPHQSSSRTGVETFLVFVKKPRA
ncbi:MAG: cupin domain-containing protein [Dongiaceae bacterium]